MFSLDWSGEGDLSNVKPHRFELIDGKWQWRVHPSNAAVFLTISFPISRQYGQVNWFCKQQRRERDVSKPESIPLQGCDRR